MDKLNASQTLTVEAYDRGGFTQKLATGKLLTVDNQIDPSTGTLKLKASFENTDNALFPNQFVNVKLLVDTKKNVVLVPVAAIQHGNNGTFVYIVDTDNNTVSMKPVTVGTVALDGSNAEITKRRRRKRRRGHRWRRQASGRQQGHRHQTRRRETPPPTHRWLRGKPRRPRASTGAGSTLAANSAPNAS